MTHPGPSLSGQASTLDDGPLKLVTLLKRRPGLTMAAFIERYEAVHVRLGERLLAGSAIRYVRRYLYPWPEDAYAAERPFDVVMEIWFPDRDTFEATMTRLREPSTAAEIAAEEEQTFDRSRTVRALLTERESDLPPLGR